jgi:endonuclease/exonuclease/phosphatase (EEP) superfamily protein YafD
MLRLKFWGMVFAAVCCAGCFAVDGGSRDEGSDGDLVVVTCNVGDLSGHTRPASEDIIKVLAKAADADADVFLLQEVYGLEHARILARGLGKAGVVFSFYTGQPNGVAILSDYPLENSDTLYFTGSRNGYGAIAADIRVKDRVITLVSLHMDSAFWDLDIKDHRKALKDGQLAVNLDAAVSFVKTEFFAESARSRAARELTAWLEQRGSTTVIAGGDFNTVPFTRAVRAMAGAGYKDALWPSLEYLSGTYHRISFPVKPRIDYLFYTGDVQCLSAGIGESSPGDHYSVWGRFKF